MTTISGSTSALSSLTALYAAETASSADTGTNGASGKGILTSDQVKSLVGTVEGSATSGISTLFGQSTTSPTDLSSIIDAIQAQSDTAATDAATGAAKETTGGGTTGTSTSPVTEQQKAATLMQSIYQTQQSNLFTLLG
jgi:hypothetical protein